MLIIPRYGQSPTGKQEQTALSWLVCEKATAVPTTASRPINPVKSAQLAYTPGFLLDDMLAAELNCHEELETTGPIR